MRAETVKRMILLSIPDPPEDLEELVELYARLWNQENDDDWRPIREETHPTENVIETTESVTKMAESVIEPPDNVSGTPESAGKEFPVEEEDWPSKERDTIRGFAHLRCEHCGKERTFCARSWQNKYTCASCGQVTSLKGSIHPARAVCKCGNRSIYSTNLEESGFDIPCVVCGAPMPVVWVPGRNRYESPGWVPPKGKRRGK